MELQMTITLGNLLSILSMLLGIVGTLITLDRRIEKKADKEIMGKEFETIKLTLQKLSDQISQLDKKIDELKGDYERYGVMMFKDKYNTDDWISQGVTVVYY